jgi:phenylpropionate dioxygenase-like ring-hydroxylating dioxygenase large terminal subunit
MFKQHSPAPVPADDLAAALAPFGRSRMLPREAYVDAAVFEWEQANIFSGWTCVGHASELSGVGAQRAVGSGANAVLLVRGDDDGSENGGVRAFANTCRHRGHELLACGASAKRRNIVCPYHAWSYRLDGRLRNAPGFSEVDGFAPEEFGLAPLRLTNWHGWLFVDPSGTDVEFSAHVAGMEDVIAPYRPEELTIVARHSYERATNWKVIAENYQECYHCSSIHPELSRISPPTSGENLQTDGAWIGGWMSMIDEAETMSLTGASGGVAIAGLSEHELRTVMYVVGYPNLLVSLHPDYVMTHRLTPLAVDRTRIECAWAFAGEVDPAYAVDFWDLTNRQDWAACESVQRGLRSPYAVPGPLAPAEDGVHQFVQRVARAYLGSVG